MNRQRTLGNGDLHVLDYLKRMQAENPTFFLAIQGDGEEFNGNIFWADSTARMNYSYFGDAIRLYTSYRTSRHRVPLATITGLNHHGQPILFGCALLFNESDTTFTWLLQNWLQAMPGNNPLSITTDLDQQIQMAVTEVLPETRHRFCKWSIFQETKEKLAHLYYTHPTFEMEFNKCIHETETVDEFESCWASLLEKYSLVGNEWLQSIYTARHKWVPAYMRETFFGELYMSESSEASDSFFDGYVNEETTIQSLIKQYEKAVTGWHEKELKADLETTSIMPVLKTPSPMEKQAANLYTRRVFMKFQEELVETLANPATKVEDSGTITLFRVAKFGEDHKAHIVKFDSFEMKAFCSCHMFDFSGIICRHVLSVFRAKNVLTLPSQYILKRWTRDAKSGGVMDECALDLSNDSRESVTVRYTNLQHEATKFVEEGAKSIFIYNIAMDALQEAAKKVSASKKQSSGATLSNGDNQEVHVNEEHQEMPHQSMVEKEKKIRELTAELNSTKERCEVYRANLLVVLRDMEDQKLKLSVKVQNARLSLKE